MFNLKVSSLEYCVDMIIKDLGYIKILDDMNYPYFIDPRTDLSLNFIKILTKNKVDNAMMNFLLYHQPINSQILTEELVCDIVFEYNAFPEELFRQLYDIVVKIVEEHFLDYNEYVKMQQKYFI
jgi:hypothetical protein